MNNKIKWEELTENFLKECTYTDEQGVHHVAIDPQGVIDWIKAEVETYLEYPDHLPEVGNLVPEHRYDTIQVGFGEVNSHKYTCHSHHRVVNVETNPEPIVCQVCGKEPNVAIGNEAGVFCHEHYNQWLKDNIVGFDKMDSPWGGLDLVVGNK